LLEPQQHGEKHGKHTQRRHPEHILHAHVLVYPGGNIRPRRSADIYQSVVNGIADGANVFLGRPRRGADHARFDQRDAERGKHQHKCHEYDQRHRVANRGQPGRSQRSQQEVGATQDQVGQRQGAAKSQAIGDSSAEYRQKPDQPSKQSGEAARLLYPEVQSLMKIAGQRCERGIVREPFKEFADIGDPERTLKPGANLVQSFGKSQKWLLNRLCNSSADNPAIRITFLRLLRPDAMVTEDRGTFKRFARNSTQAALALPSTGGAVKDSFSAPPSSPVMAFFRARGWILTAKVMPSGPFSIDNMQTDLPRRTQRTPRKAWKPSLRASPCPPWLMPFPLSEDGCAHTHAGRTFFNCNFKIVRHAHRQ